MGIFKKKVKVSNINDYLKSFKADFWDDTRALYSLIPMNYLEQIGFKPKGPRNMIYADGKSDKRLFGYCTFEIEGMTEKNICPVIAGNDNSLLLLGSTALENFAVEADPVNKELKTIFTIMGGFLASR